ncbi:ABC transporter permease [Nocardia sp. NPDC101769]|uniref:ABC transporter permease n=1 Tax=Nocardia sp. NPDC101769 TaxID=3364333 RepID=UPI00381EEBF8
MAGTVNGARAAISSRSLPAARWWRGESFVARWSSLIAGRLVCLVMVLTVVFATVELLPGGGATAVLGRDATPAQIAAFRTVRGLDHPLPQRFWNWLSGLFAGDLGTSLRGASINDMLAAKVPNTMLLGGTALIVTAVVSIVVGGWWFLRPRGAARLLGPGTTAAVAVPEFVIATLLVFVFALALDWLPAVTVTDDSGRPAGLTALILPVAALAIPQCAWNIRATRAALDDVAALPHVHAAVLDGFTPTHILRRHVLPVAAPTIAASLATSAGTLLGGALVVEAVFNYPGVGSVLAGAVADRDAAVVAAVVAVTGVAITVVLIAADLVRAWSIRERV